MPIRQRMLESAAKGASQCPVSDREEGFSRVVVPGGIAGHGGRKIRASTRVGRVNAAGRFSAV